MTKLQKVFFIVVFEGNSLKKYLQKSINFLTISDILLICFKRGKRLKDTLVRAKFPCKRKSEKCEGCQGKRCGVCKFLPKTERLLRIRMGKNLK